ncbi:MAG: PD-(D/E)XK nuclease family protein [Parcubacteria group bacterium]|nr:PD-(D/E)XK nuclease family protein [Parcubacteria group bacterium]
MRISYSSLENFKNCPLKYKYSEIDKIKEPKTKEAIFGNYIHQVLKWFYQQDPHFPTLEGLLEYYYNHWPTSTGKPQKEKAYLRSQGFSWQDEHEEKDYFQEGMRILEEYYKKNFPPKSIIMDLETKFEAVVDETPNEPGGKHILTGVIDRIDKLPDDTIEIIDYKTGKRIPSQNDVDTNLQLSIYALGLQRKWPKIKLENLRLSLYFLKFGEKIETSKTQEDIIKTQEKIIDLIHQIQKSSFEPKSSPLCNWCGYRPLCPLWRHLYEDTLAKELNGINIEQKIDEYFKLREEKEKLDSQLKELKNIIELYSRQKGLKRVFGNNGSFNQEVNHKISFDKNKLKEILEPLGKWDEILAIDPKKLQKVMKEIPPELREEIEKIKKIEKSYQYLEADNKSKKDWEEELH